MRPWSCVRSLPTSRPRSAFRSRSPAASIAERSKSGTRAARSWIGSALSSSPKKDGRTPYPRGPTRARPTCRPSVLSQASSSASSLLREVAEVVVLAIILYFGISFAVQAVHVEGLSMYATLDNNDYLIANKIDYRLHAPQRGDIIILRPPTDNSKDFIKRVIALPGEKLLIRD